jgi:glycosyltransferase involved in cell wall biosynthesis
MGGSAIVSVVIPAWNEETTIGALIDQVKEYKEVDEIVVVDDGSADDTGKIAKSRGAKVLRHEHNMGKGRSLIDGVNEAKGDVIILMDADLQHDPSDIPKFLKAIKGADMVIGERDYSKIPAQRKLTNMLCSIAIGIGTRRRFKDVLCGYRCIRKSKVCALLKGLKGYEVELGMLKEAVKRGLEVKRIQVVTRYGGKSKMRLRDFISLSVYAFRLAI